MSTILFIALTFRMHKECDSNNQIPEKPSVRSSRKRVANTYVAINKKPSK